MKKISYPRSTLLPLLAAIGLAILAGCGGGSNAETDKGKGLFNYQGSVPASGSVGGGGGGTGGGGGSPGNPAPPEKIQEYATKVAACASADVPESGLQGQVPAAVRAAGFKGFNCNMELVGQYVGEGGDWSAATFRDSTGRHCAYYATHGNRPGRMTPGVPVIDFTDPTKPVRTMSLTSPAMIDPWESLRVNAPRQMLFGGNGDSPTGTGGGGPDLDIYDLSADCSAPQLLSSTPLMYTKADSTSAPMNGHEGNISPDGLTYYVGDLTNKFYHAVDVTNPTRPKIIASFDMAKSPIGTNVHGLSVSKDGNRMYGVATTLGTPADVVDPNFKAANGFVIFDTSEVQARKPDAQIKVISSAAFKDGALAQHTVITKINGKPHIIMVDEAGPSGLATAASARASCAAGLFPFPTARIYDVSDETKPVLVSKLALETHNPANCDTVIPDVADLAVFTYGSHYCSVDDLENTTAMACSYFNSGIRVFDIRDPYRPKEIAYFNPPGRMTPTLGSAHVGFGQWRPGGPDWCASRLDFDKARGTLTTMCQDNGLLVMKFKNGVWPMN